MGLSLKRLVKGAGKILKKAVKPAIVGVATFVGGPALGAVAAKGISIAGQVKSVGRQLQRVQGYGGGAPQAVADSGAPMGAFNVGATELRAATAAGTVSVDRAQLRELLAQAYEGGRRAAMGL